MGEHRGSRVCGCEHRRTGWRFGGAHRLAVVAAAAGALVATVAGSALVAVTPAAAASTLTVSTSGTDTGNCQVTACATLGYALSQAGSGDTITVNPGTYTMTAGSSNTVPSALMNLTIASMSGNPADTIIDATGAINGIAVNADGVTVSGLTVENSGAAGIMVSPPSTATAPATVTGETIENDVVKNADQCQANPSATGCAAAIGAGDYGESIWLMSAEHSTLETTTLENGLDGGLLVSDELGPNDHNTIMGNRVLDNAKGCGITLAGHNPAALGADGQPDPSAGGVYDNTVEDNTSNGAGANGIGLFNFAYDNTIEGNSVSQNGGPGIEIDDDIPFADLNGNTVTGNTVGVNSLLGGPGGDSPGQHTVHTTQTAGILVIARGTAVTGTVISNNTIAHNYFGIWMSRMAASTTLSGNRISVTPGGVPVYIAPAPGGGSWSFGSDGGVFTFGQASFWGSTGAITLNQPVVGMAATPDSSGYWLVAKDGGIFAFGSANYYGSLPGLHIGVTNIVGIASTADGGGYWLVGSDGGVYAFGDATFHGSTGAIVLNQPVVGMAATPDSAGYWLVARDGGIFAFGDAKFHGSTGGLPLNQPVVGMAATSDGEGYWLVAKDGGIFAFGDAKFHGSTGGFTLNQPVVGTQATPDDGGYWLVARDGGIFAFGDAAFPGSLPGLGIQVTNILGLVSTP